MKVIKDVVRTEKAVQQATVNRTIMFVVDMKATKPEIKEEVERVFKAKVKKVRTQINFKGQKIAYVKFAEDVNVEDIASSLNMA